MTYEPQLARLGLFDARVPRYTSYPTAPHFGGSVDHRLFTDWVEAIPEGSAISLYLHVPFCRRLCWFCACRTQGTTSDTPVIAYAQTLRTEIAMLRRHLPRGVTLSRLHWGGGTPTLLTAPEMLRLAEAVFETVPMGKDAEFSVEIDPNEIDAERLDALAASGMNRASIGVQDFDPIIQKAIGREQSYELTRSVADMIRNRGVDSLNADILYGLPHQTKARISDSVQKLLTLTPDRVALYGYAHVPWMSRRQQMIPSDTIPTPQERLRLFETAAELFRWDGYDQVGIDHFARPADGMAKALKAGTLRRNFQGYTDDTAPVLIGLGASSISRFPQGFAQNASGTSDYTKAIRAGQFSTHRGHVFAGEDQMRARIIEALMCDFHVNRAEILRDFDCTPERLNALLHHAADGFDGMVKLDATGLSIPPEARPLARMVARAFDAYDQTKAQHSAAV
ncbi:MAG: oxygen-independent coproporphyrinogen III oxidase [Pseudotabrizicola sp.]|uniref:oxygen-independent coproporphyrinogen III oxidase n=1 Tax=Pseudotabrizicola sp. TaxID=2939647 RepID=UPI00271B266A|nr:oxygen-independent coproporphyrinogen III oxidase [Pseudotabrizicola sp.]MDO8882746.1 oxygen-independent coproporphyrinogen III oxidase [Pseudotabrizicola sp.]MDP2082248.1 oxygen-independent coproporphyrinogen III oxidase [Pseudotabrizicola sp.]MDZ7575168.1 oxygen-independent coproporphyrinogen III oxidase [Pseudotabrizicola sp.]